MLIFLYFEFKLSIIRLQLFYFFFLYRDLKLNLLGFFLFLAHYMFFSLCN